MSVRSLGAAASGIDTMQTDLDTIGNDIANSETDGFKSGTAQFEDLLTEQLQPAGAASGTSLASTNPVRRSEPARRCRRSPPISRRVPSRRPVSARTSPLRATGSWWSARTGRSSTPVTVTCRSTPTATSPPRAADWCSAGRRASRARHPRGRSASLWDRPSRRPRPSRSTWAGTSRPAPPRRSPSPRPCTTPWATPFRWR